MTIDDKPEKLSTPADVGQPEFTDWDGHPAFKTRIVCLDINADVRKFYRYLRQEVHVIRDHANFLATGFALGAKAGLVLRGPHKGTIKEFFDAELHRGNPSG